MRVGFAVLVSLGLAAPRAEAADPRSPWQRLAPSRLAAPDTERVLLSQEYQTVGLDAQALLAILNAAPLAESEDARARSVLLALPLPEGGFGNFRIENAPILAPELAAEHPEIRTYRGVGIDDPSASARFDWTPQGFHAMILSASGTVFVDPWSRGDTARYVSYRKRDYRRRTPPDFRCLVSGVQIDEALLERELGQALGLTSQPALGFGPTRRSYRLAVAATGEYTAFHGGQAAALSAITTTINRVTGIYERDAAVGMSLIPNENSIIYTNAATDPYSNFDGFAMLCQNHCNLVNVIGSASFDIGHVFSTGGGGIAGLGVVCSDSGSFCGSCPGTGSKGWGVTGSSNPVGDPFDVDYVAHEIGHQFAGNHTFNGTTAACGGGNRNASTAYEPGSGSTIMAYAGICGAQDVQPMSDDYFHAATLSEFESFVVAGLGATCDQATATGNTAPSIDGGPDRHIPKQTPFTLTASVNDVDGDPITVTWEEFDLGSASPPDNDVSAARPIFRSFPPASGLARTFPKLADVLNPPASCEGEFECLPARARTLTFRATARDLHGASGTGGTASDDVLVTIAGGAGPFAVTSPTGATTWGAGAAATVTWDVAGTSGAPVSCANVAISFSSDDGASFPTLLAASTPNDGSQAVTAPGLPTSNARVKVACVSNVFFNISARFAVGSTVSIVDAAPVVEGDAGTVNASFDVSLSAAATQQITVDYATANGTATGADYVSDSGTLTFNVGQLTKTVTVAVKGDLLDENDETFLVNLSNSSGAGIADGQGVGTITDDDPPPSVSIGDASVTEGNSGTRNLDFSVMLSIASGRTINVSYATADGSALAGADYTAASGTLTFNPGQTARTATIKVRGDTLSEGNESFFVNLSGPVNVTIADAQGQGTIIDDDLAGTLQFASDLFKVSEGAAAATVRVTRSGGSGGVSVDLLLSDGSAQTGIDVSGPTTTTLVLAPNAKSATVKVPIVRDTLAEPEESLVLRLSNPVGFMAALGEPSSALLAIRDNDQGGKLQFAGAKLNAREKDGQVDVTIKRLGGNASAVTVDYATAFGTADASDFTPQSGTLTFAAGERLQTVTIPLNDDASAEGSETFSMTLSNPGGGGVLGSVPTTTLTILDDDGAFFFEAPSYSISESKRTARFVVKRSGDLSGAGSVEYATSDGTATAPDDYAPASGVLSFKPKQSSSSFSVAIVNDQEIDEGTETVNLQLQNPVGANLGSQATALLNIEENDPLQVVEFVSAGYMLKENLRRLLLKVRRSEGKTGTLTVDYASADGSANAPADYGAVAGTLTFNPGQTTQTIEVVPVNDGDSEGTESFTVTLSNPSPGGVVGAKGTAKVDIVDDEPVISFRSSKQTVSEGAASSRVIAKRSAALGAPASVDYVVSGGTATSGVDYVLAASGTLSFPAGKSTVTLTVDVVRDTDGEPAETLELTLQNPSAGYGLGSPDRTTLTIRDNDKAGTAQLAESWMSVLEDAGSLLVTVTRSGGSSSAATVDYATSPGADSPATPGTHFQSAAGTLSFAAGERTQSFGVTVLDDGVASGNHSLTLSLSNPGGNLALGKTTTAVLWIVDVQ